jgi:hypothetical protein
MLVSSCQRCGHFICSNADLQRRTQRTTTTALDNDSTTATVIDISTDDRAPKNVAYRYHPDGSDSDSDGDVHQRDINWTPAPPEVRCLAFHPWGPWHAGKYITYENRRDNHYINIVTNMTRCFSYYDPRIQEWHDQN